MVLISFLLVGASLNALMCCEGSIKHKIKKRYHPPPFRDQLDKDASRGLSPLLQEPMVVDKGLDWATMHNCGSSREMGKQGCLPCAKGYCPSTG